MKEAEYQELLVRRIYAKMEPAEKLRDVIVYINDPNYIQGIPDLSVFYRPTSRFAMLEVKISEDAPYRPNQLWYIETWGSSIFTSFIYPENEAEVLDALQHALQA